MKKTDSDKADELAVRYLGTINRLTDRKHMDPMTQGIVHAAIRSAVKEALVLGRTSMHDDLLAEHRL